MNICIYVLKRTFPKIFVVDENYLKIEIYRRPCKVENDKLPCDLLIDGLEMQHGTESQIIQ